VSAPTPVVRAVTYERDGERCVSCGRRVHLEYQHRQAVGMGGSKVRPRLEQGVTSCVLCNGEYERTLQVKALRYGWKVRRTVRDCSLVPVFYPFDRAWYRLTRDGRRERISTGVALIMMRTVYGEQYDEWEAAA